MHGEYQWMRKVLKNMDNEQLIELFTDLEDIEAVTRIADIAYYVAANNGVICPTPNKEWVDKNKMVSTTTLSSNLTAINKIAKEEREKQWEKLRVKFPTTEPLNAEQSETEEWKEQDDAQRYQDIKSTQDALK